MHYFVIDAGVRAALLNVLIRLHVNTPSTKNVCHWLGCFLADISYPHLHFVLSL